MRVLYGVSPIGLGHASRAAAVAGRLAAEGAVVRFVTGGPAAEFLRGYGFEVDDVVAEPVPSVRDGEMKNATAWYLRYWRGYGSSKRRVKDIMDRWRPGVVVGDEEFSSVSLALEEGIPHAMISDELELGFARGWVARKVEARVSRWYRDLQSRVSLLIVPDIGVDSGNRRYVGPVVRERTKTRDEVVEEFSLPRAGRLLLLALSGAGVGGYMLDRVVETMTSVPDSVLVVMGNRGSRVSGDKIFDLGMVREGQNLVAAADLVVSTAGKSTIDEAARFGTPIIAVPIRHHSEQEKNASELGYSSADLDRLSELVGSKLGRREAPRSSDGARLTSQLILSAHQVG